jgi:transcription initiation factor IIF auxiliary subunit
MKTYIRTFILLVAFGFSVNAMSQGTSLTVFSENGEHFIVYVNGIQKNSPEADHVTVEGLIGPSFKVRIVFKDFSIHEINKTVFNTPGGELYYAVRQGKKKGEYVLEKTSSDNVSSKETAKETSTTSSTKQETKQSKAKSESNTKKAGAGCDNPMTEPDFQASTVAISSAPYDGIKLTQAKKMVDAHCLYARQIAEAMYLLSYESSRLSLAKEAYKHCYDPENYNDVKEALHSNKSKDDLDHYIQSVK